MSRLKTLVTELYPDSVQFKPLGEIAHIARGKRVVRKDLDRSQGYPVFQNSLEPLGFSNKFNRPGHTAFVICAGAAGNVGYSETDFWAADDCFTIDNSDIADSRFLYHVLLYKQPYLKANVRKGSVPRLSPKKLSALIAPVPPIEIQREIVRILDSFRTLIAILDEELAAREKQLDAYTSLLLSPDYYEKHGIDHHAIKLGELGKICMCKRVLKQQTSCTGEIPFYKIGTFGRTPDAYISQELFDLLSSNYSYPKRGDILISAAGTIGRRVVFDGKPAYFQDSNIVWIDNDETSVLNNFLFYIYGTNPWFVEGGGTIARLYNYNLAKAVIDIPPIDIQRSIVAKTQCNAIPHWRSPCGARCKTETI
jgi:type I restriction enzyme, S subunit